MGTKKRIKAIVLATVLCLSVLLAGCGGSANGSTGKESSGITDEASKTGGNGIAEEGSKAADAETPSEGTSAPETPAEDTSNAETAAENTADTEGYVEIWYDGELKAKVPSKPLESWTLFLERDPNNDSEYKYSGYYDDEGSTYFYNFFPASNTWVLVCYHESGSEGTWERGEDGSWSWHSDDGWEGNT